MANAIIVSNPFLDLEIMFRPIKSYIKIALKDSFVEEIFTVSNLSEITAEMLSSENTIIIKDIVPEITEFDKLIEYHTSIGADISFFATDTHSHTNGIVCDENDNPCSFGHGDSTKIDVFIVNSKKFIDSNFKMHETPFDYFVQFVDIADSTVVLSLTDVIDLNTSFKEAINYSHIENGTYILDPSNTYISPDVLIEKGVTILPNTTIKGASSIGDFATIGPNSFIDTCVIGENVKINNSQAFESVIGNGTTVGPFAYIRPQSNIGQNVKIGDFVEIKKASIGDGTKVSHLTYIGDATVGKNVNFGCGTVVVNYDGFSKNQTIVEDNAFIGCNTNLVSPVTVGAGAYTAAGSTITSKVPNDALAIARTAQVNKDGWALKYRMLKK